MKSKTTSKHPGWLKMARRGVLVGASLMVGFGATPGCLERPVSPAVPNTSNVFVRTVEQTAVDKIDLLFMIDNSASMADKQEILAAAVPDLVSRLVNPVCVDTSTDPPTQVPGMTPADPNADCPMPLEREFKAIRDIHIGIITSSLGGHGADSCSAMGPSFNPTQNDGGRLIARSDSMGTPVDTAGSPSYLAWDPDDQAPGVGFADSAALNNAFTTMVTGAGETGCGFEASLEAWYRFLIDPDPYERIDRVECFPGDTANGCSARAGTDQILLQQRRDFMRPDSLLAIIMLSDENDCSVVDDGQFYIAVQQQQDNGQLFHLPRPTDPCLTNPDDPCCHSCRQEPPSGCPPASMYQNCSVNNGFYDSDSNDDQINLRCFDQKRRFGIDFLYPIDKYVRGLIDITVPDRGGNAQNNPIYSTVEGNPAPPRTQDLVFLAGILGVPWQLIDNEELSTADSLVYKTAEEILQENLWDAIVGRCPGTESFGNCDSTRQAPTEPLMIESVVERTGTGPTGATIAPSGAMLGANPINGHEWAITQKDDLQYACVFPLANPRPMGTDCTQPPPDQTLKPLCQNPGTGAYETTQYAAKAFPTTRQLEVLKGFGENSIVASICARNVDNPGAADFGYRPAIAAIVDRLKDALQDQCLPRALDVADDGTVPCAIVEAVRNPPGGCNCNRVARQDPASQVRPAVFQELEAARLCGGETGLNCELEWCLCEVQPAGGTPQSPAYTECLTQQVTNPGTDGWCYVDPAVTGGGDPTMVAAQEQLVASCDASQRRKLRFVGEGQGAPGSVVLVACIGEAL